MSVQLWDTDDAWPSDDGDFVTYADHVAALAAGQAPAAEVDHG